MLKPYDIPRYDPDKEKWIDLDGTKNFYLHLTYGSNNPITDINFYYIAQKHEHKLVSVFSPRQLFIDLRSNFYRLFLLKKACTWYQFEDMMLRVQTSIIILLSNKVQLKSVMPWSSTVYMT